MPASLEQRLVIGIASRALFDLDESHHVFEESGIDAYANYQIEHEDVILEPGPAFGLVKKLLAIKQPETGEQLVEVILLSRNSADTGLRIFNSIQHYKLNITRAAFTNGQSPHGYGAAFNAHLFLSPNPEDVCRALSAGYAAATIMPTMISLNESQQLRIAFDGDAVLFSDDSERIYQQAGLEAFLDNEQQAANQPLSAGPFKNFLSALHRIQSVYGADDCPIRTALITARSAPAHERVIKTLRSWGIRIDEALFLGGLSKGDFLKAFGADFFFDDQTGHCESASSAQIASGHVPHGVMNES